MKKIYILSVLTFFILSNLFGQVAGDFRSKTSGTGNWNDFNAWERYDGTSWLAATTGQLPTTTSTTEIKLGDAMIVNATALTSGNLTVNGSLTYHATTVSALTVSGTLTVSSTGSFTSPASGTVVTHALNIGGSTATGVGGNLVVDGTFNMNTFSTSGVVVTFYGTSNNTISGVGSTINFYSLTVNKGTSYTATLEVTSPISCADATATAGTRLTITMGTFKLSSSSTLRAFYGSNQINAVGSAARLWINNAGAVLQSVGAGTQSGAPGNYTFAGITQLDAGTLSFGNGSSYVSTFDRLYITGGTLNVYGYFYTGSVQCTMTGGNINVYPQVGTNSVPAATSIVSFGNGGVVYSGGTLTIVDPNPNTGTDIAISGSGNLTGCTLRFGDGVSDLAGTTNGFVIGSGVTLGNVIVNNVPSSIKLTRKVNLGVSTTIGGNLTINNGTANQFVLNGYMLTAKGNISNSGTFIFDGTSATGLVFSGTTQQTLSGTGTFSTNINNLTINNTSGANPAVDLQIPVSVSNTLNLASGSMGSLNSSGLTIGKSSTSTTFTVARSGGSLTLPTTYSLSGVTLSSVTYTAPSPVASITTGSELPPATPISTLTVNNAGGVILDKPVSCTTLALTSGILTATSPNTVTVTGTLPTNITGGGMTAYVNGPLTITIPNTASAANYRFYIGKAAYRLIEFTGFTTTGTGTGTVTAEVFDNGPFSASAGAGLSSINTDKYWSLKAALGSVSITSSTIKITDASLIPSNKIGQANISTGTYNTVGGSIATGAISSVNPIDYSTVSTGTYFRIGSATGISAGTYAIGPQASYAGYAGTFAKFSDAVSAITSVPLTGNMIFEFQPDYNPSIEAFPINLSSNILSNATATIKFGPAAGVSSVINFSNAGTVINNTGADYIIFDGRNGGTGTNKFLQFTNTGTATPAVVLTGDANYNQFLYLILKGSNTTSAVTTSGIIALNSTVAVTAGNNFLTIDNCNIDGSGSAGNCLYSYNLASDITITNNNFYDFRNGGAVFLNSGSNNAIIDNNNFYQPTVYNGFAGTTTAIFVGGGNNVRISNNNIGGSGSALAGTWTVSTTTPAAYNFYGINTTSLATTSKIYNNKIQNFDWKSTPVTWTGISASGTVNIGTDGANYIGNNTAVDNIKITYYTTNAAAQIYGINVSGTTVNVDNNIIGSITTVLSGATGIGSSFTGVNYASATTNIRNNIIGSTTIAKSINIANQSTTGTYAQNIYGINATGGSIATISGNTIANMYSDMTFASTSVGLIRGIKVYSGSVYSILNNNIYSLSTPQPMTGVISSGSSAHSIVGIDLNTTNTSALCYITGNTIYDLVNTAPSAAVNVMGIYCQVSTSFGAVFDKNYIHSFSTVSNTAGQTGINMNYGGPITLQNNVIRLGIDKAGNSITSTAQINGIVKSNAQVFNAYFNTIYIGGSGVAAGTIKTYAFYLTSHATEDIRNNIFANARTNAVANPLNYAISLTGTLTSGFNSDYNIYNASSTDGKLATVSAADKLTLSALQTALSGFETHSGFGDPLLASPASALATMDLHPASTTAVEGTGVAISTVTDDITGALRSSNTPTDIGAYSGNYTLVPAFQDIFSPSITYNNLGNGSSTISRLTSNFAAITDLSGGINVTSGTKPRLYYKTSTNANAFVGNTNADNGWKWVEATGSTSPFDFNIDYSILNGTVTNGTVINYFVVVQNVATTPAVRFNPAIGAVGTTVATSGMTAPTTPNSYTIVSALPISVNVGTSQTYTTLTGTLASGGFFAALNAGTLTANTVATITSDITEPGTTSLNLVNEDGPNAGKLTLTIQSDGNPHVISGTAVTASTPMISITGAKRLIIDGGASKLLTFRNTNATSASTGAVIQFNSNSQNDTIRNCYIESNSTSTTSGAIVIGSTGINNVAIVANQIRDARGGTVGAPTNGVYSATITNTLAITNNNIYNLKNAASNGLYLSGVANGCTISGNSFYCENGVTPAGSYTGIYLVGSNHMVSGNYIGGSAPLCAGATPYTTAVTATFTGIYLSNTSGIFTTVQGNTIQNINMTAAASTFYGINNVSYGSVNLTGNIIGSPTTANSIQIYGTGSSAGINQTYGYVLYPCSIDKNTIANITLTSATATPIFYGMKTYSNLVRKNLIYNIGTSANVGATIYGIYNSFGNTNSFTNEFSNNVISLNAGVSTTPTIYGFYEASTYGTTGFYYNSINIYGTSTGAISTYAFFRNVAGTYNLNNNILVNTRTGGTGLNYAIYSIPTTILTSNNNDLFVAGTTLGHWGATGTAQDKADIAAWKTASVQDANSISADPLFTSSTNLLQLGTSPVLGLGIPVSGISTDITEISRSLTSPSLGAYEVAFTCTNPTSGGTIAGDQANCGTFTPITITSTTLPSGNIGGLVYKWQLSTTSNTTGFVDIANSNSPTYAPAAVTQTTWFKRLARVTCAADWTGAMESNVVTMTVNAVLPVGVSIGVNNNNVCSGTSVTFTATLTNGGTTPTYQWYKNGQAIALATNATYSYVPANGDIINVNMTSNATPCTSGNPAASNTVTMIVTPLVPVSVAVVADNSTVCAGSTVTLTATPTNGGTTPIYQWYKNSVLIPGATNSTYSYIPLDKDTITVMLTSSFTSCVTGNPATSNKVGLTVNPLIPVSVAIVADNNTVCVGTAVNFTATPTNGGSSPTYQWYVNAVAVGTGGATYSYVPANGDIVSVSLNSNITPCSTGNPATSNLITMIVNSPVAAAGAITGSANFVQGATSVSYSVGVIANATSYIWTYTGTGVTINGTGTNVTLDFATNATDGQLKVQGSNACGAGLASVISLTGNKILNLSSVMLEGLYNGGGTMRQAYNDLGPQWPSGVADHITVELHNSTTYATIVYVANNVELSTTGSATVIIPGTYNGSYYVTIKHRNSLETVSATALSFAGGVVNLSFGVLANVFGGNLVQMIDSHYAIYGGDVNQDGIIDGSDFVPVDNLVANFGAGYLPQDVNGDGVIDGSDFVTIDNNSSGFIGAILP